MNEINYLNGILEKKILYPGKTPIPSYESSTKVTFHFQTIYIKNDEEIILDDSRKLDKPFVLIMNKQFKLPIWEQMIKTMCVNEVSRFLIDKNFLFDYPFVSSHFRKYTNYPIKCTQQSPTCAGRMLKFGVGYDDLNELQSSQKNLIFIFEVLKIENPNQYSKEVWQMDDNEKLNEIKKLKEKGNKFYLEENFTEAEKNYLKGLYILDYCFSITENIEIEQLKKNLFSNMAQLKFKEKNYYDSINYCDKALKIDPNNVKILYRRANCFAETWDKTKAEEDYKKLLKLDPKMDKKVLSELDQLNNRIKSFEQKNNEKLKKNLMKNFGDTFEKT